MAATTDVGNPVTALAYEAAVVALRDQNSTLANLRGRASALLGTAAATTAFATAVGLLNVDPGQGDVFPGWAAWSLLGVLILIALTTMPILWPVKAWRFGPDATMLLRHSQENIDDVRMQATRGFAQAVDANRTPLGWRMRLFEIGLLLLTAEVALLVATLTLYRK